MAAAADLLQWEEPAWELPGLRRLALVPATAALGFHHAYFLSLPERIDVPALVVEGNNQGEERDYAYTLDAARGAVTGPPRWLGPRVADRLGLPLLMPVFPRTIPSMPHTTFVHQLNRATLLYEEDDAHRRLDLQLLAMADHALQIIRELYPNLPPPLPKHLFIVRPSAHPPIRPRVHASVRLSVGAPTPASCRQSSSTPSASARSPCTLQCQTTRPG